MAMGGASATRCVVANKKAEVRRLPRIPPEIGAEHLSLLRHLAEVGVIATSDEEAARRVLELVADGLSLSSGMVNLAKLTDADREQLVPSASFGTHAQLSKDMPPVDIDSSYEAAIVYSERQPHYVSDVYGGGGTAEDSATTGRWRAMISTQSYAVLPLYIDGEGVGTITLQWPTSHAFPDSLRRLLETVATVAALAIYHVQCREAERAALESARESHEQQLAQQAAERDATTVEAPPARTPKPSPYELGIRFEVTESGVVIPLPLDREWAATDKIRITFVRIAPGGFCEVFSPAPGQVAMFVACLPAGDIEPSIPAALVRSLVAHDAPPAEVLSTLNKVVEEHGGAGVAGSAWMALLDLQSGAFTHAAAGNVEVSFTASDGRRWEVDERGPFLGSSHHADFPEELRVIIPGDDVIARCSAGELGVQVR
jgi:hypothetical protein